MDNLRVPNEKSRCEQRAPDKRDAKANGTLIDFRGTGRHAN